MKEPTDEQVIDTTRLLPEEKFNVLLLMLANALESCGLEGDFILLTRRDGRWGCHTTIRDQARMNEVLRRMSEEKPAATDIRALNLENYTVAAQKGRTKQ